jgi:two-component system cell cycle sensor histidine kinase/response regulator CckA
VVAYAVFYSIVVALQPNPAETEFETAGFLPLYFAAGLGVLAGSFSGGLSRREVHGWRFVSVGWLCSAVGAVGYLLPPTTIGVIAADVFYRSYYPLLVCGFLLLAVLPAVREVRRRLWLDVAIVVLAALTLSWYFVWGDGVVRRYLVQQALVDGIVPFGEVAVLIAAGIALVRPGDGALRRPLELLGVGALAASLGDLLLVRSDAIGHPQLRAMGDVILAVSAALFTIAGLEVRRAAPRSGRRTAPLLPYAAIATVGALIIFETIWGGEASSSVRGLLLGAVILTALVIARSLIAEREARAQAAARVAQEARFRALVQRSGEALLLVDADGIVRWASESATRVFGVDADAVVGERLAGLGAAADSPLVRALERPEDGAMVQWDALVGDVRRTFETVVSDRRGDPLVGGLILTTRDASERIVLERRLLQSQKLDALGLLAGGVAHDFNNLLAAIRANADLVASSPQEDPTPEIAEIQRATERGAALCRQLLAFGRPGKGESTVFPLSTVLRHVLPMLRRVLPSTISLELSVPEYATTVLADRSQVEVAMLNLVMNARDAIQGAGTIRIVLTRRTLQAADEASREGVAPGDYLALQVTDSGAGMDAATMARVFEPFFTTKGMGGSGLGLAMVYGLMKGMGGQAQVRSTPGAGTEVTLLFPFADVPVVDRDRERGAPPGGMGAGRILVVDDEPSLRDVVNKWLSRAGFEVLVAADGIAALELLEREGWRVDAMISDISMPRLNGLALVARVRARLPQLPIILMSGFEPVAVDADAVVPPDVARLQKPFPLEVLLPLLHDLRGSAVT